MSGDETTATERSSLLPRPTSSSSTSSVSSSKSRISEADAGRPHGFDGTVQISRPRAVVMIVSTGLLIFLQATNISMLTTIQSNIAADLDAFEEATWFTSAYLVAMSSMSPLVGRFTQVFSPRGCIIFSSVIISAGSIITSLASTLPVFLLGRAATGLGAGGVLITSSIIIVQLAPTSKRGLFLGLMNSGMTTGVSLGAVLAGALEPKIGWKVLFGAQAPLSMAAGTALYCSIPKSFAMGRRENSVSISRRMARIDYLGALTLTSTIVLFLVGLSSRRILIVPVILSFVVLPAFLLNEIYLAAEPIIPITVLKSRGTLLTCLATVGFMMSRWAVLFYSPVYAIAVRSWSPAVAGSILIPTNVGFGLSGIIAGWLHIRRAGSFYLPSILTMLLFPVTMLGLSMLSSRSSSTVLYVTVLFCNGLATGSSLNYSLVHALHLTPAVVHPIVLSLVATFRGFAGSFGSAIGGGLFQRLLAGSLQRGFEEKGMEGKDDLIRKLLGSPALVRTLGSPEREVAETAYVEGLRGLFLAGVGLSVLMVLIQAGTGWKGPTDKNTERHGDVETSAEEEGFTER